MSTCFFCGKEKTTVHIHQMIPALKVDQQIEVCADCARELNLNPPNKQSLAKLLKAIQDRDKADA